MSSSTAAPGGVAGDSAYSRAPRCAQVEREQHCSCEAGFHLSGTAGGHSVCQGRLGELGSGPARGRRPESWGRARGWDQKVSLGVVSVRPVICLLGKGCRDDRNEQVDFRGALEKKSVLPFWPPHLPSLSSYGWVLVGCPRPSLRYYRQQMEYWGYALSL